MDRSKWVIVERLANQIYLLAENALCNGEISEEETAEVERAAGELFGTLLDSSAVDAQKG
jgi:hypothetical protein